MKIPRNKFVALRCSHQILAWLQNGEEVTIKRIRDEFGIAYAQARSHIKVLEELYPLSIQQNGRTKIWKWGGDQRDAAL